MKNITDTVNDVCMVRQCTLTVAMLWAHRHIDVYADINDNTNNAGADPGFPVGGMPTLIGGGANLRHRHFSVKTYVKTKEFGPVGGGGAPETFVCRSATAMPHF